MKIRNLLAFAFLVIFITNSFGETKGGNPKMMNFKIGKLSLKIDQRGFVVSLFDDKNKREYLASPMPLLSITTDLGKSQPTGCSQDEKKGLLELKYEGDITATIEVKVKPTHTKFTLREIKGGEAKRVDWGPFITRIGKTIGETVGVVRDDEIAIGIQALNIQTIGGAESAEQGSKLFAYSDSEGGIDGSSIALFSCPVKDALQTIGKIEIGEGLPHPMLDGQWAKVSPSATLSYLITDFSEANFDEALALCAKLGFKYIYHPGPFETWGHFILDRNRFPDGDESLKRCVEKAKKKGIRVGLHTLTSFITPNDPYVSPKPDRRLGGLGSSELLEDIDEKASEIPVSHKEPFLKSQQWGWQRKFILIDEEIIEYEGVSEGPPVKLIGCKRGLFGTVVSGHIKGAEVRRLATHYYGTFYPGIRNGMMDEMTRRIAELFNYCGLQQISFDGLEGLWDYEYKGPYAAHRFVKQCYDGWKQEVINDASGLLHYLWHIHTRMNWGEPWGKPMREGMPEYRLKNQDYFERNLFPHMMGWFEFRTASPELEATTLDEIEWMLSKCAGCDAGFALVTSPGAFKINGQGEAVAEAIKNWEELRHRKAFTEEQKKRLRELKSEWHLEKVGENRYLLFPLEFSTRFFYPQKEREVGWDIRNKYGTQPLRFVLRVLPEAGDRTISNPEIRIGSERIIFPVQLRATQYLVCEGSEEAIIYDWNWNRIGKVKGEGELPLIPSGDVIVNFNCDVGGADSPVLWVLFKMVGKPEEVVVKRANR